MNWEWTPDDGTDMAGKTQPRSLFSGESGVWLVDRACSRHRVPN